MAISETNIYPMVSVIVCTYNDGKYIGECICSILRQTYSNFELVIVNDGSTDSTHEIITSFNDPRIKYFKMDNNSRSIGKIRNYAIKQSEGRYIFFTDGDCHAREDWIMQGMTVFQRQNTVAVEGKIIYYADGYHRTLSDRDVANESGGYWMCANMAFRREIFHQFNFNPEFRRLEDREFALRIINEAPIPFASECVVYHQKITRGIIRFLKEATLVDISEKIRLIRDFNDKNDVYSAKFRIFNPKYLLVIIFPPLIMAEFFAGRVHGWDDLRLLPFIWFKAVYMRLHIWKIAIREKYLLL